MASIELRITRTPFVNVLRGRAFRPDRPDFGRSLPHRPRRRTLEANVDAS